MLLVFITGCTVHHTFDSYSGLVMAGYQGWFNAEGDGSGRGFYHYGTKDGFCPGNASIDLWPDVSEYSRTYPTEFKMSDGSIAHVFSSEDYSTVETHFKWMSKYGIDGVFMQRFVNEIKMPSGKKHFDHVLDHAMKAARKFNRAIAIMYDLSGMDKNDVDILLKDIDTLSVKYKLFNRKDNQNYLYHNGRPLVAVWGIGFNDVRNYNLVQSETIVDGLIDRGFSVMIGVPTFWRTLDGDTEHNPQLHSIIRKCDILMPWFVGRYDEAGYDNYKALIKKDIEWTQDNGIDYAPLVYPGFSWRNMCGKESFYVPRNNGKFFKKQIDGSIELGAKMLYVAMFDEIDEGTAIFKCSKEVPISEKGTEFVPVDSMVPNDIYLRLAGSASKRLRVYKKCR